MTPAEAWCLGGAPGSGKSTLGLALARATGRPLLDLDTLTNPLMAVVAELTGAGDDLDHPSLRGAVRTARYRCLVDAAADLLAAGCSPVLVAPFTREAQDIDAWDDLVRSLGVGVCHLIWVRVPAGVARQRRRERGLPRDERAAGVADGGPSEVLPAVPHLLADGTTATDVEVARLVARLLAPS